MENVVAKMADNLLNPNAPLFGHLKDNPPAWWEMLKNDSELYIDVRKDNKVMVYYQGGRVACLTYKRGRGISAMTHPKYVGVKSDKEQEIAPKLDEQLLKVIKSNIRANYSQKSDKDIQEKLIQGECVIRNRNLYIDSEFAHRRYVNQNHTIRIDLVKIIGDEIIFEELKNINDGRLRTTKDHPEIIEQMNAYREFILENHKVLEDYYKKLLRIKIDLRLPTPPVQKIDRLHVRMEPELTIFNTYTKLTTDRIKRIQAIDFELQGYDYKIVKY